MRINKKCVKAKPEVSLPLTFLSERCEMILRVKKVASKVTQRPQTPKSKINIQWNIM